MGFNLKFCTLKIRLSSFWWVKRNFHTFDATSFANRLNGKNIFLSNLTICSSVHGNQSSHCKHYIYVHVVNSSEDWIIRFVNYFFFLQLTESMSRIQRERQQLEDEYEELRSKKDAIAQWEAQISEIIQWWVKLLT